jgi:ketosteroid isomerase-like protein
VRFAAAFNRGDYGAAASMYADDAYLLPPSADIVKGRLNIQSFLTKAGETLRDIKLTTLEVTPLGSLAGREIGTLEAKTEEPQPKDIASKYVVIWQKVEDEWKISTDIWNSNE